MNNNENTGNQEVIQRLKSAETLYALYSTCTREPYVVCDPETFDDEILMFFSPSDVQAEAKRLTEAGIPVSITRLEQKQMLMFYTRLYTMGINALLVKEGESTALIQLADFVRRNPPKPDPSNNMWVENPSLHLTALYYMQELRRKPGQEEENPQIREWQEEISNYFTKGTFIAAVEKEGKGVPIVKLNDNEMYQAIFTDMMEFQKFNQEDRLRPVIVSANRIPKILVAEASGVLLNPMGVRMPLQVKRAEQPTEGAQAETAEAETTES